MIQTLLTDSGCLLHLCKTDFDFQGYYKDSAIENSMF